MVQTLESPLEKELISYTGHTRRERDSVLERTTELFRKNVEDYKSASELSQARLAQTIRQAEKLRLEEAIAYQTNFFDENVPGVGHDLEATLGDSLRYAALKIKDKQAKSLQPGKAKPQKAENISEEEIVEALYKTIENQSRQSYTKVAGNKILTEEETIALYHTVTSAITVDLVNAARNKSLHTFEPYVNFCRAFLGYENGKHPYLDVGNVDLSLKTAGNGTSPEPAVLVSPPAETHPEPDTVVSAAPAQAPQVSTPERTVMRPGGKGHDVRNR